MTDRPTRDLRQHLARLKVARVLAAGSNDIPLWRTVRRRVLGWLLDAPGLRVGSHVRFDRSHPELGGRLALGRDVELGAQAVLDISGGLTIEDAVTVSEGAFLMSHDHGIDSADRHWREQGTIARPLTLRTGSWVGARAVVTGKTAEIGPGSVVGAASLVTKPVPRMTVVAGSPARVLRRRGQANR